MTKETYEQAAELVQAIAYNERVISVMETMLEKFDDTAYSQIDSTYKGGSSDIGLNLRHTQLPELREALQKGLERQRTTLKDNQKKLEAL